MPLSDYELKFQTHKARLFFASLQEHGLFIIWYCLNKDVDITHTTVYNNTFYAIYINQWVIKCYYAFGYEKVISETPLDILNYLDQVRQLSLDYIKCDLYSFKLHSLASIAMALIKQNSPEVLINLSPEMLEFINQSFFGGRCELYKQGHYDFVAAFDFPAMYGNLVAGRFPKNFSWAPFFAQQAQVELPCGFIEATVSISKLCEVPPLPYRHPRWGVIYPTGIFRGVFWWEELWLLQTWGGLILEKHRILFASEESVSGEASAQPLLELKEAGHVLAKKLLNSIYGRLALTPTTTKTTFILNAVGLELQPNTTVTNWRNLWILEQTRVGSPRIQNNKAIAAIITARARCKLYKLILVTKSQGDLLYIDTDEIFIRPHNFAAFTSRYASWQLYRSVTLVAERVYRAQPFLGLELERGNFTYPPRTFLRKRIFCGADSTPPHM